MTVILKRSEIEQRLESINLLPLIEEGFVAYSQGNSIVPPVGELQLEKGEVHIKYGFIKSQSYYVIKIASGFYGNSEIGLSTSGGCMLVFCQTTGQLKGVLLDDGHLTDIRTAVAGAIAAKHLAPKKVNQIGVIGTGIQAQLQLCHLRSVVDCRNVLVWGRSANSLINFVERLDAEQDKADDRFEITATDNLAELQQQCNLIVTTTPSNEPLLSMEHIQRGTHITAVGSDMPDKQELDTKILANADLVVADSIEQCNTRGEISQAIRNQDLDLAKVGELGNVISGDSPARTSEQQITVADLTGVAVQDIQIATAVIQAN